MKHYGSRVGLFFIFAAVLAAGFAAGCCAKADKESCQKAPVVARINNYELTAGDFIDEARFMSPDTIAAANTEKAKEDALNSLITKKILLQQAQALNFDKDKNFRKEIERYWEQALLKLLMKRKIDEFAKSVPPEMPVDIRQKMIQDRITKWVTDLRNTSKVKIYKENLEKVEIK